ncbi:Linear gramicidin dehydrogenase LgrE [Hyella patelloides LEGE 07179]|uniref:Linear gramicidin dehydrogenase LgrE n=1 Tax=Hyella patelloides LEGE 07179 TaxID=945734 RepID=A0A563W1G5_9CYAN|nr:thioesterase II family protein [Hyella patelloides]VEP17542.1 Linear gramicidin dehydrogenase LgrE [Hyella patelloides LEGE 07179]
MKTISNFNSWITCPQPKPQAQLRLFCFPYGGGSALSFRTWLDSLPSEIEVCPIELPGRGFRMFEAPYYRLEPLIKSLVLALLPNLNKPFVFFGHSMGALISYEVSQLLRSKYNIAPLHLFVSGHRAPHLPDLKSPIHNLPQSEFIQALRDYNGTPEEVLNNEELMELFLPILRADFSLIETHAYSLAKPLNCPIDVFGGSEDWTVNIDELKAWQEHSETGFSLQMFPGDHFFLHSAETIFLSALTQKLEQIATL